MLKKIEAKWNEDVIEEPRNYKYVDREEDPEIKRMYDEENAKFEKMHETLNVDGEIDMDMHGNVNIRYKKDKDSGI